MFLHGLDHDGFRNSVGFFYIGSRQGLEDRTVMFC